MTDKGEKMKSKCCGVEANPEDLWTASICTSCGKPCEVVEEKTNCPKCNGTGTYLDPNGRTAGDCPICRPYPHERPNLSKSSNSSPAEPDSELRENIAEIIFNVVADDNNTMHWKEYKEYFKPKANVYQKIADSILALSASQKDKEIVELKEKLATTTACLDLANESNLQGREGKFKMKAKLEARFASYIGMDYLPLPDFWESEWNKYFED